jgi:hypothetical protein
MPLAWPFLISRNQKVDYTTVVLPSFMDAPGANAWLVRSVEDDGLRDEIRTSCVEDARKDPLFLIYRVTTAKAGDSLLRDGAMRPILWIEGVVLRGSSVNVADAQHVIETAHQKVLEHFRAFWNGGHGPRLSASFDIELQSESSARAAGPSIAPSARCAPPSANPSALSIAPTPPARAPGADEGSAPSAPLQHPTPRRHTARVQIVVAAILAALLAVGLSWRRTAERRELLAAIAQQVGRRPSPKRAAVILVPNANDFNLVKRATTLARARHELPVSVLVADPARLRTSDHVSNIRQLPAAAMLEAIEDMQLRRKFAVLLVDGDRCISLQEFNDTDLDNGDAALYLDSLE